MLVLQGTEDGNAYEPSVTASVKRTCDLNPGSQLEYIRMENITHVPVLYAGQHTFLDWIRDRFAGKAAPEGCSQKTWSPSRGYRSAEFDGFKDQMWFLEYDVYGI